MLRGRRTLVVLILIGVLFLGATITVRWLLRPENLTRVITAWVERELDASLTLSDAPGVRLIPRLQLSLDGVRLERNGALLASAEELRVALPWSALWRNTLAMESLSLRRPIIAWPQLTALLRELSDPERPSRAPRLPQFEVGMRVEEGTLLSGGENTEVWRIDQISLVTTPLLDGEMFHLDAGARIQGTKQRTVSLSLRARPNSRNEGLLIEDAAIRAVVSPENLPLAEGMTVEIGGSATVDADGLAAIDFSGRLPGWPDWLPNALGFQPDQPVDLDIDLPENARELTMMLAQGEHRLETRAHANDIDDAVAQIEKPLHAIANLRSQWRLDALTFGDLRLEGIELDVTPIPAESVPATPDDAEDESGNNDGD